MNHGAPPRTLGLVLCLIVTAARVAAQEMEPKAYSASPVGANFFVVSYSWSTGSVVFDPALPIRDVHADVQGLVVGVGHTFNLFGKLGLATAAMPYVLADVTGQILEQSAATSRSGLGDARLKLSVNLRGNPALAPREFVRARRRTIVGASVTVSAPAGQYYDTKLINVGANRWSVKPEIGIAIPKGRWDLDAYVGGWFYTANPHFYPGDAWRSQDPLLVVQGHASYTIRSRLWVAADATWYRGGRVRIDRDAASQTMNNSRAGVTLSLPVGQRYSAKVAVGSGVIARTGTDFSTVAVAWQMLWLSPRWSGR